MKEKIINKRDKRIIKNSEKGITLISLLITIIILIIIAGVSVSTGMSSIEDTRLKGFYSELEIIKQRVDAIADTNEAYEDLNKNTILLKETGRTLTIAQQNQINLIDSNLDVSKFKYFTKEDLYNYLDLYEMNYNVFIDFEDRIVISEEGITVNGTKYYMLENTKKHIVQNTQKNIGIVDFNATVETYGANKFKINIEPSNIVGDLDNSPTVKYKKNFSKYWETTNNLYFIVDELTTYDVQYIDANGNKKSKTISISLNEDNLQIEIENSES